MTGTLAASRGYKVARAAYRSANGAIGFGKRRHIASIQSYNSFALHHEPSVPNCRVENGTSAMSWRGISYYRTDNEGALLDGSNGSTSLLSEMSRIRFVGELWEEDDGG